MKYTHVIWDFNGTIFDDLSVGVEAINTMLKRRNMPILASVEEYRSKFGFPIKDYYAKCGFDFEKDDYETVLAPEWVEEYNRLEKSAGLCHNVKNALELLSDRGISQSILSASRDDMLISQINRLGISDYFDDIIGCDNFFAYGKAHLCKKYVFEHPERRFIMIGDTTHDHDVAKSAGIDCALVTTGHMSRKVLSLCGCEVYDDCLSFALDILK